MPATGSNSCCCSSCDHPVPNCACRKCVPQTLCATFTEIEGDFDVIGCCSEGTILLYYNCVNARWAGVFQCSSLAVTISAQVLKVNGECCFEFTLTYGLDTQVISMCGDDFAFGFTDEAISLSSGTGTNNQAFTALLTVGKYGGVTNTKVYGNADSDCPDCRGTILQDGGGRTPCPIDENVDATTMIARYGVDNAEEFCRWVPSCLCLPTTLCIRYFTTANDVCLSAKEYASPMTWNAEACAYNSVTFDIDLGGEETVERTVSLTLIAGECNYRVQVTGIDFDETYGIGGLQLNPSNDKERSRRCNFSVNEDLGIAGTGTGTEGGTDSLPGSEEALPVYESLIIEDRCDCKVGPDTDCIGACLNLVNDSVLLEVNDCDGIVLTAEILNCEGVELSFEMVYPSTGGTPEHPLAPTIAGVSICQDYVSRSNIYDPPLESTYSILECVEGTGTSPVPTEEQVFIEAYLYYPDTIPCPAETETSFPKGYRLRYNATQNAAEVTEVNVEPTVASCDPIRFDFPITLPGDCSCSTATLRITL